MTDRVPTLQSTDTIEVVIAVEEKWIEILSSELDDIGFHAFVVGDNILTGYVRAPSWNAPKRNSLISWLTSHGQEVDVRETVIREENWNANWEATITPIVAGDFIVIPSWQELPISEKNRIEIRIDPKMSFGTGHHETTRLMLDLMSELNFEDATVLDAGTGTGVLAIAAALKNARAVLGFDHDPWSTNNGTENIQLNNVSNVSFRHGSIEVARGNLYDIVLANIIQNVIEDFFPDFTSLVRAEGHLLISGILQSGKKDILSIANSAGFDVKEIKEENEWVGFHFIRRK